MFDQIAVEEDDKNLTAEKVLTSLMNEALQKKLAQQLVPRGVVFSEFKTITIDSKLDTPLSVAVNLGKHMQVDYVVVGIVWEYK